MRKLNRSFVDMILSEMRILREDKVISTETETSIKEYYSNILQTNESQRRDEIERKKAVTSKRNPVTTAVVILGIISGILIGTGVISLIAINWHFIPRGFKVFCAFIILMIPQILAFYFKFVDKREFLTPLKEGLSILWALLFGGVFAFISQIFKTASQFEIFLFVWSISTIGIVYLMDSITALILYKVLIVWLVIYSTATNGMTILFYPLLLLLIPYFVKDHFKASVVKRVLLRYFGISLAIIGIALSLSRVIHGLWIIVFVNIFALLFIMGNLYEDRKNIFLSPMRLFGTGGLVFFSFALLFKDIFRNIGISGYHRGELNFIAYNDVIVAIILFLLVIIFAIVSFVKKKNIPNITTILLLSIIVSIIYLLRLSSIITSDISAIIFALYLMIIIVINILYNYLRKTILSNVIFYLLLLIPLIVATVYTSKEVLFISLYLFLMFIFFLTSAFKDKSESNFFSIINIISKVFLIVLTFGYLYFIRLSGIDNTDFNGGISFSGAGNITNIIFFTILFVISIYFFVNSIKQRETISKLNLIVSIFVFLLTSLYFISSVSSLSLSLVGWILTVGIFIAIFYIYYDTLINGINYPGFITASILVAPLMLIVALQSSSLFPLGVLLLMFFYYLSGELFYKKTHFGLFQFYKIFGYISIGVLFYIFSFYQTTEFLFESISEGGVPFFIFLGFFILNCLVLVKLFIDKVKFNYFIILFPLLFFIMYLEPVFGIKFLSHFVGAFFINMLIFLFCVYEFIIGIQKKSILIINLSTIFLLVTFISRFITLDINLLLKAFMLILCGNVILALNIILLVSSKKRERVNNESK